MNIFYFILISVCILTFLIQSVIKFGNIFHRSDCYMSLTHPIQYVEIPHFFPTGPLHLLIEFQIEIIFLEDDKLPIERIQHMPFIRTHKRCNNSMILSTKGILFKKMIVTINVHLFDPESRIAQFCYTFKNGFTFGHLLLLSQYTTFGIIVQIEYLCDEYMPKIKKSIQTNWEQLQFVANTYDDICVVTDNNKEVIIRPVFIDEKSMGYTSFIFVNYEEKGKRGTAYQIPAFDCDSEEKNPNQSVVFFDKHPINTNINFFAKRRYISDTVELLRFAHILLPQVRRENINRLNQFKNVKKVFFFEGIPAIEIFSNSTKKISLKSEMGYIYRAYIIKKTQVMFSIARNENINLF